MNNVSSPTTGNFSNVNILLASLATWSKKWSYRFLKDGLEAEILRETCKLKGLFFFSFILQHTYKVTLKATLLNFNTGHTDIWIWNYLSTKWTRNIFPRHSCFQQIIPLFPVILHKFPPFNILFHPGQNFLFWFVLNIFLKFLGFNWYFCTFIKSYSFFCIFFNIEKSNVFDLFFIIRSVRVQLYFIGRFCCFSRTFTFAFLIFFCFNFSLPLPVIEKIKRKSNSLVIP